MKEEEHWGSYLVEKDCLCRERENGAMIYFLLAGIVLLRHLFMGWAVLSFIITSFCGLSSNLYHKPNCKSYCVSFSFSSKKKKKTKPIYIGIGSTAFPATVTLVQSKISETVKTKLLNSFRFAILLSNITFF